MSDEATLQPSSASSASSSVRYNLLVSSEEKAREKWRKLQDSRLKEFASHLPAPVAKDSAFVSALHKQMNQMMADEIRDSIAERCREWNVRERLEGLDGIIAQEAAEREERENDDEDDDEEELKEVAAGARGRERAWRPSGNPADDQAAHDLDVVQKHKDSLESSVMSELNKELTSLHSQVQQLQSTVERNEAEIADVIKIAATV